jgi:YbbR domain-containing protein
MKTKVERQVRGLFFENISYKLISLLIALILWITILGRRDFVVSRKMELELVTAAGLVVKEQSVDQIKIKVSGPRTALRRFVENGVNQVVTIDLAQRPEGTFVVEIPRSKVDLPFGVKLVSMTPSNIEVKLEKR